MDDAHTNLTVLDAAHADVFQQALTRVLSTQVAELTFAEILDGLPTEDSYLEFHLRKQGHPVFELKHTTLCPGVVERMRAFRDGFDPLTLSFPSAVSPLPDFSSMNPPLPASLPRLTHTQALSAFQQSSAGSQHYELRLIELLAVACHQLAVYLYNLDDGIHPHRVCEEWRDLPRERVAPGQYVAPTAFYHRSYLAHDQYPNGLADIVGYWAEAKIFGGAVLFDRGESGTEVGLAVPIREHLHAG